MNVGTKSLLFGVHQFIWHPITVYRAWCELYPSRPTWRETLCIVIHDWGYWGCESMDGADGELHPYFAARLASLLLDRADRRDWFDFVLRHSRYLSKRLDVEPSSLCWADKCSMLKDPWWFYSLRARLSGELAEYRVNADRRGFIASCYPDREWHRKLTTHLRELAAAATSKY